MRHHRLERGAHLNRLKNEQEYKNHDIAEGNVMNGFTFFQSSLSGS
jgi:hypothetical protein